MKYLLILFLYLLCINLGAATFCLYSSRTDLEDVKSALLQLERIVRDGTDMLVDYRAEDCELKETIFKLSQCMSKVHNLDSKLTSLDRRITGIEGLISQRDEQWKIQIEHTIDTLKFDLVRWVKDKISKVNAPTKGIISPVDNVSHVFSKLNKTESLIMGRISKTESILQSEIIKLNEIAFIQSGTTQALFTEIQNISLRITDLDTSLRKVKEQLQSITIGLQEPKSDIISNIGRHVNVLHSMQKLLQNTSDQIRELPRSNEVQILHSKTELLLHETKHTLKHVMDKGISEIESKLAGAQTETKDAIGDLSFRMNSINNAERACQESNLKKGLADYVLDIKNKVEYGMYQILFEIRGLVKEQGININNTLTQRFDDISNRIMQNQNGASVNLNIKVEEDTNQVLQRVNVMNQQMTENAKTLDKLYNKIEDNVNGTTLTVVEFGAKVNELTKRITEVHTSLDLFVTQFSQAARQFSEIQAGLGTILRDMKISFKESETETYNIRYSGSQLLPKT